MAERSSQKVYLFNCDHTYNLDVVEKFLLEMDDKHGLDISTEKLYFGLNSKTEICEGTIPQLQMDFAAFVVHAEESRLSINEENAGIGYAMIYRALLEATGDKVFIVIGGDDHYEGEDEEERSVISRWARRKVASQFNEEYLDGRKSFIFSWNKRHREIHEEALLHYFDPTKKGQKFEYQPKPKPVPLPKPEEPEPEKPDVTPSAAGDTQQEFVVDDDREQLVPSDENEAQRRSISDREGQTQELTSQQGGASYGIIDANRDYPKGTVLLETLMRYGEISYEATDVVKRENEWQPPDKYKADLKEQHGLTPEAKVEFVSDGNGAISYSCVVTEEKPWWRNYCNCVAICVACAACVYCIRSCCQGFSRCMRATWAWICNCVRCRC